MNLLEKTAVTPEFCARADVYNIKEGGNGRWNIINSVLYSKGSIKRHNAMIKANKNRNKSIQFEKFQQTMQKKKENKEEYFAYRKRISNGVKRSFKRNPYRQSGENNPMFNYKWSQTQREQLSKTHTGQKNSMFGKIWIYNEVLKLSFRVSEELFWMYIGEGWRKGRVLNWSKYLSPEQLQLQQIDNKNKKEAEKKKQQCQKINLLHDMYEEFKKNEFAGVVEKFNYKYTRNNLIMAFKKYISEYIPAKCNRWKNRKKNKFKFAVVLGRAPLLGP